MLREINTEKLKKLNQSELAELCSELRERLIETVNENGGHLASNLGVVELTVALHRVLNCPVDKLVFDVGHQSYVHKLLTGRESRFSTLRTLGGISGFPKMEESEYDAFGTGHSSTSISAALGLAHARDIKGESNCVAAVIGDGALTGGMAYEALNDAGRYKCQLMVILNDNDMSIARNVGALQLTLTRMRSKRGYLNFKRRFSRRWPKMASRLERVRNSVKYLFLHSTFFEELGFKYFGPIDGHDISALELVLGKAKQIDRPVLVHVVTQKGRGYGDAENRPEEYHGVAPYFAAGRNKPPAKDNSSVFGEALCELAEKDERIVAVTAAMPKGTGLAGFAERFPNRFFDVGIAEQHAVTMCAAMAAEGMKPVFAVYSSFMQRAYDQLIHDVCLQRLPVVFAIDRSGPVGEDGPTHHGAYDIGYLSQAPGLTLASPSTMCELRDMLKTALSAERPFAIRYGRGALPEGHPSGLPFGKAAVLRPLQDVNVVAAGRMVQRAQQAVDELNSRGIKCGLVDLRYLKPLDEQMLMGIKGRKGLITLEDGVKTGGIGERIALMLGEPVKALALPDKPLNAGSIDQQLGMAGISAEDVIKAVESLL